jgi:hypothetical protein
LSFATWDTWTWDLWDVRTGFANFLVTYISDYAGYLYILFGAEFDNIGVYERSFVLGTDFENQRGLGHLKRLLKARLFLESETSGTINIQVKRDTELVWQNHQLGAGQSLVNANDELSIVDFYFDFLALHYKFKIFAENRFVFLGAIFWIDPDYGDVL